MVLEYKEVKNITSKLHQTAQSIGFTKKALHNEVTPKLSQVKGNFINFNDRYKLEMCILLLHLNDHVGSNKLLIKKHHYSVNKLKQECGRLLITAILQHISTLQKKKEQIASKLKTMN